MKKYILESACYTIFTTRSSRGHEANPATESAMPVPGLIDSKKHLHNQEFGLKCRVLLPLLEDGLAAMPWKAAAIQQH